MRRESLDELSLPDFLVAEGREQAWQEYLANVANGTVERVTEELLEDAVSFAQQVQQACPDDKSPSTVTIANTLDKINDGRRKKGRKELTLSALNLALKGYWRFSGALEGLINNGSL